MIVIVDEAICALRFLIEKADNFPYPGRRSRVQCGNSKGWCAVWLLIKMELKSSRNLLIGQLKIRDEEMKQLSDIGQSVPDALKDLKRRAFSVNAAY